MIRERVNFTKVKCPLFGMYGSFNEEALEAVSQILDFTRCRKPDGSTYGSRGKCKQGVPVAAEPAKAPKKKRKKRAAPVFTPEQRKQFDSLYQDKDDAASDRRHFGKKIRDLDKKARKIKSKLKKAKAALAKVEGGKPSAEIQRLEALRREAAEKAREAAAARQASEARLEALRARLAESEARYGKLTGRRRRRP